MAGPKFDKDSAMAKAAVSAAPFVAAAQSVKSAGGRAFDATKSAAGSVGRGANAISSAVLGNKPWANLGMFFIFLAVVINLGVDFLFPFAGFDLAKYGRVTGVADFSQGAESLYFLFKGPLLVLLSLIGAWVLNRRHVALRVFVAILVIVYGISMLPAIVQQYFLLTGIETVIFILFCIQLLKEPSKEEYVEMIFFWVPIYALFTISASKGNVGALIHLFFVLIFYMMRGSVYKAKDSAYRYNFLILLFFDFLAMWALQLLPATDGFVWTRVPILIIGTTFMVERYEKSKLSGITLFLLLMGLVFWLGWGSVIALAKTGGDIGIVDLDKEEVAKRWSLFDPRTWLNSISQSVNRSIAVASGDAYSGSVDANAKKNLGVYLEGVEKNQKNFAKEDSVVLFATLTAENLKGAEGWLEEPLKVTTICFAKDRKGELVPGEIFPPKEMIIDQYSRETMQCTFENGELVPGSYDVSFQVDFTFPTQAYLKRYFVSKERLDSLRRQRQIEQDKDMLTLNGIQDTQPVAKSTAGPVQIKASDNIPVVMKLTSETSEARQEYFGLLLENVWEGKIKDISEVKLWVPDGISVSNCNPFSFTSAGTEEGYSIYSLSLTNKVQPQGMQVPCYLELPPSNSAFLGQGEVTTRYFRIEARYDYTMEKKVAIRVADTPAVTT